MNDATISDTSVAHAEEKPSLGTEIDSFISHVESIGDGFMLGLILATQQLREKNKAKLEAFEAEYCEVIVDDGNTRTVKVPNEHLREWKKLSRRVRNITLSLVNLPRSLLVSLISHYDAYLGRIIRTIYLRLPDLLNTSERKLTFEELTKFDTIDAVREFLIEKEVESVLRSSHIEQFKWMERIYGVVLTKDLKSWSTFIELTERRNLFVHTNGVISSQYLSVCKKNECTLDEHAQEGAQLGVPQEYFEKSIDCIYEIGIKLGHVLWRKIFPAERADADKHLIGTSYDLLVSERYRLASVVLDFTCIELKTHSNEVFRLMLIVNRALAYKWMGDERTARNAMKGIDWTAKSDEFKLANAVIHDDWAEAKRLMLRIGKSDAVSQQDYLHWPLFREWRKRDEFKEAYMEVFGQSFGDAVEVNSTSASSEEAIAADEVSREGLINTP